MPQCSYLRHVVSICTNPTASRKEQGMGGMQKEYFPLDPQGALKLLSRYRLSNHFLGKEKQRKHSAQLTNEL